VCVWVCVGTYTAVKLKKALYHLHFGTIKTIFGRFWWINNYLVPKLSRLAKLRSI